MSKRTTQGCLGVIAIGAILYACTAGIFNPTLETSTAPIQSLQAIAEKDKSGSQVVLPTSTQAPLVPNSQTTELTQPTAVVAAESSSVSTGWGVVTANVLNVRSAPTTDGEILGTLVAGNCVELIGEQDGWFGVRAVGNEGWSSAEFITVVEVCPTVVPPTAVPTQAIQQEQPTATSIPPTPIPPSPVPPTATPVSQPAAPSCDPNYEGTCIPLVSYDLNCPEVGAKDFYSVGSDPHGFDRDNDGLACES